MSDISKQLLELRAMTARTGAIHQAQALQLKMWAALVSPRRDTFEVSVDPVGKVVQYSFRLAERLLLRHTKHLDASVKWLLGDDWLVRIRDKTGKAIFTGRRQEMPVIKTETERQEITPWRDRLNLPEPTSSPSPSANAKPSRTSPPAQTTRRRRRTSR